MEAGRVGRGCGDVAAVEGAGWTFQRRGVCAEVARAIGSRVAMRAPRQLSRCRLFLSFIGLAPRVCCDCRPLLSPGDRDRTGVVWGKGVAVRVGAGGWRT